jgi:hypothetical protein
MALLGVSSHAGVFRTMVFTSGYMVLDGSYHIVPIGEVGWFWEDCGYVDACSLCLGRVLERVASLRWCCARVAQTPGEPAGASFLTPGSQSVLPGFRVHRTCYLKGR